MTAARRPASRPPVSCSPILKPAAPRPTTAKDTEYAARTEMSAANLWVGGTRYQNCIHTGGFNSSTQIHFAGEYIGLYGSSDDGGVEGAFKRWGWLNQVTSGATEFMVSDTGTLRSGGANVSLKVTPSSVSLQSTNWILSRIKLLELPIYASTASKQYDLYFIPTATADWTADPTAVELWIELEAWGHATNAARKVTKSTGVIDMNGSLTWQALSVTVAPAQAGVAFLRAYYAKPIEASKANSFFIDPIPVIT